MILFGFMINKFEYCNYDNLIFYCYFYSYVFIFERCKGKFRDLFLSILYVFVRFGGLKKFGIKVFFFFFNRLFFEFVFWIFFVNYFNGML